MLVDVARPVKEPTTTRGRAGAIEPIGRERAAERASAAPAADLNPRCSGPGPPPRILAKSMLVPGGPGR
jgi:hypothetical protein